MERSVPEIPGYVFIEQIASGRTTSVWRARQSSLDRDVAVKILFIDEAGADERELFLRQARLAARMKHPHLIPVLDSGHGEHLDYMVMEYAEGDSLRLKLADGASLPESQVLELASQLADALHYAWREHGLAHGAIMPGNVLLSGDGKAVLGDLSASIAGGAKPGQGAAAGKRVTHYSSPEQIAAEYEPDCRCDIYGLGALLYHMLTGQPPFALSTEEELPRMLQYCHARDPRSLCPDLSDGVTALLQRMLARSPEHRYPAWDEVRADLSALRKKKAMPGCRERVQDSVLKLDAPVACPMPPESRIRQPVRPGGKKQIAIRKDELPARAVPSGRGHHPGAFGCLLFLILLGAGLFAIYRYTPLGDQVDEWALQVRERLDPASGLSAAQGLPPPKRFEGWREHPDYLRGQALYEEACGHYAAAFQKRDRAELAAAEEKSRAAIAAFRAARHRLPAQAGLQRMLDRCFHLISDVRHPRRDVPGITPLPVIEPPRQVQEPTRRPRPTPEPPKWREDADYVRGVQLLREASQFYDTFLETRNQNLLVQAEEKGHAAVKALLAAQPRMPAEARVDDLLRRSNQLISNCHHSRHLSF